MTKALESVLASHPASDSSGWWSEAIIAAAGWPPVRKGKEDPAKRLLRLRETLQGELVAFHDRLIVSNAGTLKFRSRCFPNGTGALRGWSASSNFGATPGRFPAFAWWSYFPVNAQWFMRRG
jgi:hypothetical protein